MLAQNLKTAAELGLDDAEHGALVKVLGMLEREEIPAEMFTMRDVGWPSCDTPGCILGWAISVGYPDKLLRDIEVENCSLGQLFLPLSWDCDPYQATRAHAATALRSYLTTGDSKWDEAMS